MAANRAALKQKEQELIARKEEMANTKSKWTELFAITPLIIVAELFKMTKFKNVESKVSIGRPSTAGTRRP